MIDWIAQNTLPSLAILLVIMIIRLPVRHYLGAHISYALWSLPLIVLLMPWIQTLLPTTAKWLVWDNSIQPVLIQNLTQMTTNTSFNWLSITWLVGFILMFGYKFWRTVKFKHSAQLNATGATQEQLKTWGLKKGRVRIVLSTHVNSPCIIGFIQPTVYVPVDFESEFTIEQQKLILQHELQHHKKGDLWLLLLAEIYSCLFWFNPLIHFCKNYFITDQELACDRQVLKNACQQTRLVYGQALHQGLLTQLMVKQLSPIALSFFSVKQERFTMLNKHKLNNTQTITGVAIIFLMACSTLVFSHNSKDEKNYIITLNFHDIPLISLVQLIAENSDKEADLINTKILNDKTVDISETRVDAYTILNKILKEKGLKVERTESQWIFSEL